MSKSLSPESLLAQSDWIRDLARNLVREENDANDLAQTVAVKALENPPSSRWDLRAWIFGVARNLSHSNRRAEKNRQKREKLAAKPEAMSSSFEIVARAESHRQVVEAVLELEEPYRSTILYRFFDELSPEKIAQRERIPSSTVRTRTQRGLEQLRAKLERRWGNQASAVFASLLTFSKQTKPIITSGISTIAGGIVMSMKWKTAIAVFLLLGFGWILKPVFVSTPTPEPNVATFKIVQLDKTAKPQNTVNHSVLPIAQKELQKVANTPDAAREELPTENPAAAVAPEELASVSGIVFAPPGQMLQKPARIVLELQTKHGREETDTWSDHSGHFQFKNLPIGLLLRVEARSKGYAQAVQNPNLQLLPNQHYNLELILSVGCVIEGQVLEAASKKPIPHAKVWAEIWDFDKESPSPTTIADEQGRYQLVGVAAPNWMESEGNSWVTFQIYGKAPGFQAGRGGAYASTWKSDNHYEFDIELQPVGARLEGVLVRESNGKAIEGGHIHVVDALNDVRIAQTDTEGRFAFEGLAPGKINVLAQKEIQAGKASFVRGELEINADSPSTLKLALADSPGDSQLSGIVRDENGKALENIPVLARFLMRFPNMTFSMEEEFVRSDSQGVFTFPHLRPGDYHVLVSATDAELWISESDGTEVSLKDGERKAELVFSLSPATHFRGQILTENLELQKWKIELLSLDEPDNVLQSRHPGANGRFGFDPLRMQSYRMRLSNENTVLWEQVVGPLRNEQILISIPE